MHQKRNIRMEVLLAIHSTVLAYLLTIRPAEGTRFGFEGVLSYALGPFRACLLLACVMVPLILLQRAESRLSTAARCTMALSPALLILFFAMPAVFTYDTAHYLNYIPILNGEVGFDQWDIVRGPVFPGMINLAGKVLGHTLPGILSLEYLFFMGSLFCVLCMMQKLSRYENGVPAIMIVSMLLLFCNPILLGGFHALLTEFPAALAGLCSCLVAWKWFQRTGKIGGIDVVYALYFLVMSVVMWQMKQANMGTVVYPLIALAFCTLVCKRARERMRGLFRMGVLALCIAAILASSSAWTAFIGSFGHMSKARTSAARAEAGLTGPLPLKYVGEFSGAEAQEQFALNASLDENQRYDIYQLKAPIKGLQPAYMAVKQKGNRGIGSSLSLMLRCWVRFPVESFQVYAMNLLKISNILACAPDSHLPSLQIEWGSGDENQAIYYRALRYDENVFPVAEYLEKAVEPFRAKYSCPAAWKAILQGCTSGADLLFKVLNALSPLVWLILMVQVIRRRKELLNHQTLVMHFVIWSYCIGNLLIHIIMGRSIDRYMFSNYYAACASLILAVQSGIEKGIGLFRNRVKPGRSIPA